MLTWYARRPYRIAPRNLAWMAGYTGGSRLPVDIREDDNAYVISAAIPGRKADEVEIQVLEDVVTLRLRAVAQAESEATPDYLLREIAAEDFERSFRLPVAIDAEKAEAVVENGMLQLTLPKAESVRPRQIAVKAK
jgi:HSP20 family protein